MTEPRADIADPLYGATTELISAMSSLNMEPQPLKRPFGEYLSEQDYWVEHAYAHLTQVSVYVCKAQEDQRYVVNQAYILATTVLQSKLYLTADPAVRTAVDNITHAALKLART